MKNKLLMILTVLLVLLFSAGNTSAQKKELTEKQKMLKEKLASATADKAPLGKVAHFNNTKSTKAIWDVLLTFNASIGGEQGIETDGQFFYTTKWSASNEFNKYDLQGNWIESFTIAGASSIRDLTYDGQYFYGGAAGGSLFQMDFTNQTLVSTISVASPATVRHCSFDPLADGGAGGFWVGAYTDLYLISRTGAILSGPFTTAGGVYGSAYDGWSAGGPYLWVFDQGGNGADVQQFSIASETFTGVTHDASTDVPGFAAGDVAGGLASSSTIVPGKFVLIGNIQHDPNIIFVYEVAVTASTTAPAAPTAVTGTAGAGGALTAVLNWTNPTLNVGGTALTSLTGVKVYRDGELISTLTNQTIGAAGTYTDNTGITGGSHDYLIKPYNADGDGISAGITLWIGPDVPAAVTELTLTAVGDNGTLTWVAPTTGAHGGYFTTVTGYKIERYPDAVTLETSWNGSQPYVDAAVPGMGNYSYVVTPVNAAGEGFSAESNAALLMAGGILLYDDFTDGVGNWTADQSNWTSSPTANAGGVAPEAKLTYTSYVGVSLFISQVINTEGKTSITLTYKQYVNDYGGGYNIGIKTTSDGGATWNDAFVFPVTTDIAAEEVTVVIANGDVGSANFQLAFFLDGDHYQLNYWYVDDVVLVSSPNDDLAALNLLGTLTPTAGTPTINSVVVRNNGVNTQSTYTVDLVNASDNSVIATAPAVPAIATGEVVTIDIPWTPTEAGPISVYGKVTLTGDEAAYNDFTPDYTVNVQAAGTVVVSLGDNSTVQSTTPNIPLDFFWKNSLSETMYYPAELNIGGLMTQISYQYNFTSTIAATPIKIWMGETTLTDLSGGYIPSTELTLVFDNTVDFAAGNHALDLPLIEPYVYGGGNLVVMVQRPMDSQYYSSSDKFFTTLTPDYPARTIANNSDTETYDPTAPPAPEATTGEFPDIRFYFVVSGMGSLQGVVTGDGAPVEGALVEILTTSSKKYTGVNGQYLFPYVFQGTYDVKVSAYGFLDNTATGVVITEDVTTTQDFVLTPMPMVMVTGHVVKSDAPTQPVVGAVVKLEGYENYEGVTDASGNFLFPDVFANYSYTLKITFEGYQNYISTVDVLGVDLNLGTLTMLEKANPPRNVTAEVVGADAVINWEAPSNGGGGAALNESFEGTEFPPVDWTQVINNTGTGVAPFTWSQQPEVVFSTGNVTPPDGSMQAFCMWDYAAQDEWLITPVVNVSGNLTFWYYGHNGSVNLDHYYVKISTDDGASWTELWDASALPAADNYYDVAAEVDLSAYMGQDVKLAWQNVDGDGAGLWYAWAIDAIAVGSKKLDISQFTKISNGNEVSASASTAIISTLPANRDTKTYRRATSDDMQYSIKGNAKSLLGYNVWRFLTVDQGTPANWTQLNTSLITFSIVNGQQVSPTTYTDATWDNVPLGNYKFAVVAEYSGSNLSVPAISNQVAKGVMIEGTVVPSDNPTVGIEGATVTLTGNYNFETVTDASGHFSFVDVNINESYELEITFAGYVKYTETVDVVDVDIDLGTITMMENPNPPSSVTAAVVGANAVINWTVPGTSSGTPQWLMWDDGTNSDAIGTGAAADFDVAHRYSPSDLEALEVDGMSVTKVTFWPNEAAATYTVRVWVGGDPSAPGDLVLEQVVTDPVIGDWNEIVLETPVTIDATQELWVGYNVNTTTGYPAGVDAGPQVEGFGNMMYFNGEWTTLSILAPTLTFNWNIHAWVDNAKSLDAKMVKLVSQHNLNNPLVSVPKTTNSNLGLASIEGNLVRLVNDKTKSLVNYKVYRLTEGQVEPWTELTTVGSDVLTYTDNTWSSLSAGVYQYAVKAVYTNDNLSVGKKSNLLPKDMDATVTFTVTNNASASVIGTHIAIVNTDGDPDHMYEATLTSGTSVSIPNVWKGAYTLTAELAGFNDLSQNLTVSANPTAVTLNFVETIVAPTSLLVVPNSSGHGVTFSWNNAPSSVSVLVVDHDASNAVAFTDDWVILEPALAASEIIQYTYYEADASTFDGPDAATMADYDVVLWFTGEGWQLGQTMTENDKAAITEYVQGGGKFILSGMDYLYDQDPSGASYSAGSFEYDILGISGVTQDAFIVDGASGETGDGSGSTGSFLEGVDFSLEDVYTTAKEGLYIDEITDYAGSPLMEVNTPSGSGLGAVYTSDVIFSSVPLPAITDQAVITEILDKMVVALMSKSVKSLIGYDVFLDGSYATQVSGTQYVFNSMTYGNHIFGVRSVYTSGTSAIVTTPFFYTGVNNIERNAVSIYPNPAKNNMSIVNAQGSVIEIYNVTGNLVSSFHVNQMLQKVDVSAYPIGLYNVKIISDAKTQVIRVVVEK